MKRAETATQRRRRLEITIINNYHIRYTDYYITLCYTNNFQLLIIITTKLLWYKINKDEKVKNNV